MTQEFYATIQNKLHWAIHRHTAAELIKKKANAKKPAPNKSNNRLVTFINADLNLN
ncbi:MAG: RhuM family protein [Saprospiraceae bacterium]